MGGVFVVVKSEETILPIKHGQRQAKPDRTEKLEKRVEKLETKELNMAEFIFQAVSLIVGLVAIIFALLIGIPAYQKVSDTTNSELIQEINILNGLLRFLILIVFVNVLIQLWKWKRGK